MTVAESGELSGNSFDIGASLKQKHSASRKDYQLIF